MADYLKSTNFATKDALPSGNAGKIVKGTEIDTEFNAISDAVESKADLLNPVFSGLLTTDTLATTGAANIGGTLAVTGDFSTAADAQFTGTGRVLVPKGTTAQRPASPTSGSVRYNTDLGYLENYTGTEWRVVGYVTPADVSDKANTSTGYFQLPVGSIAQRPVSPAEGLIRYNAESDIYEGYINSAWHKFLTVNQGSYTITYVTVGGGGGGGSSTAGGGGGGAGQVLSSTTSVTPGTSVLTITIGAGGAGSGGGTGSAGSSTLITGIASSGGGSGGANNGGTSGNGYAGGTTTNQGAGGGGGGAATAGGNGSGSSAETSQGGAGGTGAQTLITGTSQYFGGGGGGGAYLSGGTGGTGGGGNGNSTGPVASTAGSPNTGGGGGGSWANSGASGGSGITFLSMPTLNYTGTHTGSPTISTTGANTVLKYTGSGTYTC